MADPNHRLAVIIDTVPNRGGAMACAYGAVASRLAQAASQNTST